MHVTFVKPPGRGTGDGETRHPGETRVALSELISSAVYLRPKAPFPSRANAAIVVRTGPARGSETDEQTMNSPDALFRRHSAKPAQRQAARGRALRRLALSSGLLVLAGCQAATEAGRSLPDLNELSVIAGLTPPAPVILRGGTPQAPAGSQPGSCFVRDISPAVVESITEQVQIKPELLDRTTGEVIQQAGYRTDTRQSIVSERAEIMVQTPCPEVQGFAFIATLQRALKARGFYVANVTGIMDARTRRAIRSYQVARGVNSDVLSVQSAVAMGLIATQAPPR